MKKAAATLLCICIIAVFPLTAFAQTTEGDNTSVIKTVVPSKHEISVSADGAEVIINGKSATDFEIDRLSEPTITFKPESGKRISQVLLNGEDITAKITDGSYTLPPVYEDIVIAVTTEDYTEPTTEPTTESTTEAPKKDIILGDADSDSEITIKDATKIQRVAAKIEAFTEDQAKAADVNADGKTNVGDVVLIQRFIALIETGFKIGELI